MSDIFEIIVRVSDFPVWSFYGEKFFMVNTIMDRSIRGFYQIGSVGWKYSELEILGKIISQSIFTNLETGVMGHEKKAAFLKLI